MMQNWKILVTGGSGYLGHHIALALAESGHEVTILDLIPPPNQIHSAQSNKLHFIAADICDQEKLVQVFKDKDAVIHSAGFGLSGTSNLPAFNDVTRRVNLEGTKNVINACKINKVQTLGRPCFSWHLFH